MNKTVQIRRVAGIAICLLALSAEAKYSGGTGEPNDPYQIATAADLILLGESPGDYDKHSVLTADIDLSDLHFSRAVIAADAQGPPFSGHLDGQRHRIHQLHIEGSSDLGLFGRLASEAEISSVGLVDANVVGTGQHIGLLVGFQDGSVYNCYSTGVASGDTGVGGLVGSNHRGRITASYSTGTVTGTDYAVGGLVGFNYGSISMSYSTCAVTGDRSVGGLVGSNDGRITVSYSTGSVTGDSLVGGLVGRNDEGSITSCFWNRETSGQVSSAGGTGLTVPEMQDINTYLSEGWDFVDEILNGTCDYWQISPGEYPKLYNQAGGSPVMPEGLGTAEQPYLIRDARDMGTVWFKPLAHYRLETSLDLSGITWSMAVVPRFNGTFDGNGQKIRNLHIQGIQGCGDLGLFGLLGSRANISNLGLEAVDVSGTGAYVGGLVGGIGEWHSRGGIVANCYSSGTVAGGRSVGILVGYSSGSITNSYSSGTVTGDEQVGGLVGNNDEGSITISYSTGSVTGDRSVGGLVGYHDYGSITMSYSTGRASGNDDVGGLVGYKSQGSITMSYSTGSVNGDRSIGGLVGCDVGGTIVASYSTSSVNGNSRVGGLVGFKETRGSIMSCFWNMETSGQATSAGGTGLTTPEMQDINTYLIEGWDLADEILNGTCDYWQISPGEYPNLYYQAGESPVMPEGLGTAVQPYLIRSIRDLGTVWFKPTAHYRLEMSLNLSGTTWSMAVVPRFEGTFDGNGQKISNLHIRGIQGFRYLGLFGLLDSGGNISNLGLEATDANGIGSVVGNLVASNRGSITNCYSTGTVSGNGAVGGFVGNNYGSISNSYSTGVVSGHSGVGGLVGWNEGMITSCYSLCYSAGTVSGVGYVGGLVGRNEGMITTSVWDMETSGLTNSDGGVGLTTAEMMNPYRLGLYGFANEPNWVLDAGRDYPRLAWEGTPGQIIPEPIVEWLDGQGTDQEPYRVDTAEQLILLTRAGGLWDKHFILGADIDLDPNLPGRQVFSQAVIPVFSGVFDGKNHTISHLTIRGRSYLGLFGQTGSGARISNLGLEAVDIDTWGGANVGGLVGYNQGGITMSYSTGSVSGFWHSFGGLVGSNDGSITASYSTVSVDGGASVGGLVGHNGEGSISSSSISNSYSTGMVVAATAGFITDHVGGLVGWNDGSITSSYSTGSVSGGDVSVGGLVGNNREGRIASSFWEEGATDRDAPFSITTAEMQTASTFISAGWDFVNEIENGNGDIWWIVEGRDTPRLRWETLYVDDDAPDDPGPGDPKISDRLENGRQSHPFDTIQEAIDVAPDGLTVLVRGGIYGEPIDFKGKAITVQSGPEIAVLEAPEEYAVSFYSGEGANSVLQNFVIRNSQTGVFVSGSSPTIRNLTVVDNEYGITAYTWAQPAISNCIFWNNSELDLFQCEARYSCIEDGDPGEGNLSADPLFIDANNGDYHLLSAGWCWSTPTNAWTYDSITSPCIDAGDPDAPLGDEPLSIARDPDNEYGENRRINMGAYGGTAQASMAPLGWIPWDENALGENE